MKAIRPSRERILECATALDDNWLATEMCRPSYLHSNPLVRWLFWSRLDVALEMCAPKSGETIVEFGCGLGVFLPSLAAQAKHVRVLDVKCAAGRRMAELESLSNVSFVDHAEDPAVLASAVAPGSVDCVNALDVLEHIEDLDPVVARIRSWLTPQGRVVVCGPTESAWYRLGRRLAGFHHFYHGGDENVFHEMDVFEVRRRFERGGFRVVEERWLPPRPLPRAFLLMKLVPASPA